MPCNSFIHQFFSQQIYKHYLFAQILLITDGSSSLNVLSLSRSLLSGQRGPSTCRNDEALRSTLPFNFPAKFHIVTIASPDEKCLTYSVPVYQKLIDMSGAEGGVFIPEGGLSVKVLIFSQPQISKSLFHSSYS